MTKDKNKNMIDDEWGNLGDFDANDPNIGRRAFNRVSAKNKTHYNNRKNGLKKWWSDDRRKQLSELNVKEKGKVIVSPYGEFESRTLFEKQTGKWFSRKRKSMPHLYYEKAKGPGEVSYETVFHSPYGSHNTMRFLFLKSKNAEYKSQRTWWNKMKKLYPDDFYETREIKCEWDLENET